jgi:glycosyltransferase involved in cell wall biosynthesis
LKKRVYIAVAERPILLSATTLIALTEYEVQTYRDLELPNRIRVVPNGIDCDLYRSRSPSDLNQRLGIPADAIVVLFLGRLHPIKGADKILDAFADVHSRIPRAFLVMAGPDEWGLEAAHRRSASHAGIEGRVVFPGMVEGELKLDLLARADLFALASDAEGFSIAVLEALASETAVLLSQGCHFPEVAAAGAGRIVSQDPADIARAMTEMLSDTVALAEMGRRGRWLVSRQYTWPRITERLLDVYREGIGLSDRA